MLQYKYTVSLLTSNGQKKTVIQILHFMDSNENTTKVTVSLNYDGKNFLGHGADYYWIDAIADLQKNLPKEVIIHSCLTCKHGNMCPVGNDQNEVFCLKDITPKNKEDLFFYTEDYTERDKRRRKYFGFCEDYAPQSVDYFTYNDFLCYLNK